MQFKFNLMVLTLTMILLLGIVSAQNTVIIGKVFTTDGKTFDDLAMKLICNDISKDVFTESDGTFAVFYDNAECGVGDVVGVSADNGKYKGTATAKVEECSGNYEQCNDGEVSSLALVNPILSEYTPKTSSGGKKSSSSSGGASVVAKPVNNTNVSVAKVTNLTVVSNNSDVPIVLDENVTELSDDGDEKDLSSISGYSVFTGTGSWFAVLIVLIIVVIVLLLIRTARKRK